MPFDRIENIIKMSRLKITWHTTDDICGLKHNKEANVLLIFRRFSRILAELAGPLIKIFIK